MVTKFFQLLGKGACHILLEIPHRGLSKNYDKPFFYGDQNILVATERGD